MLDILKPRYDKILKDDRELSTRSIDFSNVMDSLVKDIKFNFEMIKALPDVVIEFARLKALGKEPLISSMENMNPIYKEFYKYAFVVFKHANEHHGSFTEVQGFYQIIMAGDKEMDLFLNKKFHQEKVLNKLERDFVQHKKRYMAFEKECQVFCIAMAEIIVRLNEEINNK